MTTATSTEWAHLALQFFLGCTLASVVGGVAYVAMRWFRWYHPGSVYLISSLPLMFVCMVVQVLLFTSNISFSSVGAIAAFYAFVALCAFGASFVERAVAGSGESLFFHTCFLLSALFISVLLGVFCVFLLHTIALIPAPNRFSNGNFWVFRGYIAGLFLAPLLLPQFLWARLNSQRRPGFDVPMDE